MSAPKPNQALTASDCGMLLPGDLLMPVELGTVFEKNTPIVFLRASVDSDRIRVRAPRCGPHNWFAARRFVFIGRPGPDGWVPWSGGPNPVPGQVVDVRFRDGDDFYGQERPSDDCAWEHDRHPPSDIIAFRLASTAPAAACEHIGVGVSYGSGRAAGTCLQCKATLDEAALRLQHAPAAAGGEVDRWHTQTVYGANGTCVQASLASMLGLPLNDVPAFDAIKPAGEFWGEIEGYVASRGYQLVHHNPAQPHGGMYLASGPTARTEDHGGTHMVIMKAGQLVHDPHPDRSGLLSVDWTHDLIPLDHAALSAPPKPPEAEVLASEWLRLAQIGAECSSDPGRFAGYRGDRSFSQWVRDAILAALSQSGAWMEGES